MPIPKVVERSRSRLRWSEAIVQTRRAEALSGFRLASPLHEKKRHPAKRRVSSVSASYQGPSSVGPQEQKLTIPSALPKAVAQPKAERPKLISFPKHGTNRVKIPLCKIRPPPLLQKSLSAIATILTNTKTGFLNSQTVFGKTALTPP